MGPNIYPCPKCHRQVDVTHFVYALEKHNIIWKAAQAIAFLTNKPISTKQQTSIDIHMYMNDQSIKVDNTRCHTCLQKYSICWGCNRTIHEAQYLEKLRKYRPFLNEKDKYRFDLDLETITFRTTKKTDTTIDWANSVQDVIKTCEKLKYVAPFRHSCAVCLQ